MAEARGSVAPARDSRRSIWLALGIGSVFFFAAQLVFGRDLPLVTDETLWQVTDARFLAGKPLWTLLVSYHAQPPGLLILQWLEANLWPGVLRSTMLAAEWAAICGMAAIAQLLVGRWWATGLVAAYAAFHPSTLLYGSWFFSSIYLYALVALTVVAIILWVRSGGTATLAVSCTLLAVAGQFHSVYAGVCLAACVTVTSIFALSGRSAAPCRWASRILLAVALALVAIMPLKNYVLFDLFAPSSWGKLNISLVLTDVDHFQICKKRVLEYEYRIQRIQGDTDRYYWADRELLFTGVESSGGINMNHIEVLRCSRDITLQQDIDPIRIAKRMALAGFELVALPSWDYPQLGEAALRRLARLVSFYELFLPRGKDPSFYYLKGDWRGLPQRLLGSASLPTLSISLLLAIVLVSDGRRMARFFGSKGVRGALRPLMRTEAERLHVATALVWLLLAAADTAMVLANGQELNRMRFSLSPVLLFLCLTGMAGLWRRP